MNISQAKAFVKIISSTVPAVTSAKESELAEALMSVFNASNTPEPPAVSMLSYKDIIKQYGVGVAPASVDLEGNSSAPFENTLLGSWSYMSAGQFKFTSAVAGIFTDMSKVNVEISDNRWNQGITVSFGFDYKYDNDSLVFKSGSTATYPAPRLGADDLIWLQPIKIEVSI